MLPKRGYLTDSTETIRRRTAVTIKPDDFLHGYFVALRSTNLALALSFSFEGMSRGGRRYELCQISLRVIIRLKLSVRLGEWGPRLR